MSHVQVAECESIQNQPQIRPFQYKGKLAISHVLDFQSFEA